MTHEATKVRPVFDKDIPIPPKRKADLFDDIKPYVVGQRQFSVSYVLTCMEVGDSCLISSWAPTSVSYIQKKTGFRFQREVQNDGTVRIWRKK